MWHDWGGGVSLGPPVRPWALIYAPDHVSQTISWARQEVPIHEAPQLIQMSSQASELESGLQTDQSLHAGEVGSHVPPMADILLQCVSYASPTSPHSLDSSRLV